MPPKKKGAAAKAKKPMPPRAADPITTDKSGKEVDATAAATRPRREIAVPEATASTPVAKATAPTTTATKKRGRPAKAAIEGEPLAKRGRKPSSGEPAEETEKRGRGRPPNKPTAAKAAAASKVTPSTGKKRGRPPKSAAPGDEVAAAAAAAEEEEEEEEEEEIAEQAPPKKRGRPAKKQAPAVPKQETAPPKRRGRPPKGGQTTRIEADDDGAAEQLEEELQDTVVDTQEASASLRKAPTSRKGKGSKGKTPVTQEDEDDADSAPASGKNYWLMKAEQEDRDEVLDNGTRVNVKFTIDDLRAKTVPEPWDGVRNPTAAKNMREMKKGDMAFFYASGGKSGRKPGIVGIMEIVKEHEPDQTAWDPNAYGFVKDEKARDRWCVVHVEYRKKLTKPVHLAELQRYSKDQGALANMQEFKAARLSVSKVTEKEWNFIIDLIDGFEDEEDTKDGSAATEPNNNGNEEAAEDTANNTVIDDTAPAGSHDALIEHQITVESNADADVVKDTDLPNGVQTAILTAEAAYADIPTTDGLIPDATSATSRPASQAGAVHGSFRQASRATPVASSPRPGSRTGRARSKTPNGSVPMAGMTATEEASATLAAVIEEGC